MRTEGGMRRGAITHGVKRGWGGRKEYSSSFLLLLTQQRRVHPAHRAVMKGGAKRVRWSGGDGGYCMEEEDDGKEGSVVVR